MRLEIILLFRLDFCECTQKQNPRLGSQTNLMSQIVERLWIARKEINSIQLQD